MSNYALAITDGRKMVILGLYTSLNSAVKSANSLRIVADIFNNIRVEYHDSYVFETVEMEGIYYCYRELCNIEVGRDKCKLAVLSLSGTCGYDF